MKKVIKKYDMVSHVEQPSKIGKAIKFDVEQSVLLGNRLLTLVDWGNGARSWEYSELLRKG